MKEPEVPRILVNSSVPKERFQSVGMIGTIGTVGGESQY